MTDCILSLALRTVTDKQDRKMSREPLFLFKTPSAFDIFQSGFNNNTVCNYGALRVSI